MLQPCEWSERLGADRVLDRESCVGRNTANHIAQMLVSSVGRLVRCCPRPFSVVLSITRPPPNLYVSYFGSELSVAIQTKVGLGSLAGVIHPYPTRAESIRQAGDLYNKTKLTPVVRSLFRNLMAIKR